jgi:hypothetical protein
MAGLESATLIPPQQVAKPPDPFAGMSGTRSEDVQADDFLLIAIIGAINSGKSWLASSGPKPMLYYDWDNRKASLEGKPGLFIKSRPALTMLDVETDLSIMKANKIKKLPLPATVVHDTVTLMIKPMEDELRRQNPNSNAFRGIRMGNSPSSIMYIRQGYDVINGIQNYMQYLIDEYTCLGINQIYVFHEKDEKDKAESKPNAPVYTGKLTINPQYLETVLGRINEKYHIVVDATIPTNIKFIVECRQNNDINAGTTMMLDPTEPADIMAMIAKHKAKRAALPKNVQQAPVQAQVK